MSIHILLVDDHPIVTDGLKALLSAEGNFHVKAEARNGSEAVDMLDVLKVDLVIMDIDMPVMDGIEATRVIKRRHPDKKILMLTMHDEKAMIQVVMEAGADGYLLKNTTHDQLLKAIEEVMQGQVHISEDASAALMKNNAESKDPRLAQLTDREVEILKLISEGCSNKEIGDRLFISHRTVDTHRTNLMQKLDVHNIAGLVRFAIQNGLLEA